MNILIDAFNIRNGGGVTHLYELLSNINFSSSGIEKIIICARKKTLDKLPSNQNIVKISIDKYTFIGGMYYWQKILLKNYYHRYDCKLLFVPGGIYIGKIVPFITMCQNLLPFDKAELSKYGFNLMRIKFILIRFFRLEHLKGPLELYSFLIFLKIIFWKNIK